MQKRDLKMMLIGGAAAALILLASGFGAATQNAMLAADSKSGVYYHDGKDLYYLNTTVASKVSYR